MLETPLISIIVPCYNQAQYLPETLQSVLDQELLQWECLIVNDGSPDNTGDIAKQWCAKDTRFKYLEKANGGLADARNYGIRHAQGKYILPLDSDDKISPTYTKEAIAILDNNASVKLVCCRAMLFDGDNEEWKLLPYSYENLLFVRNCMHCSSVYRNSDYNNTQGYNTNMKGGWEDYDFWIGLLEREDKVIFLDKIHFYYRTKEVSMRTQISKDMEDCLRKQIFKNHIDKYLAEIDPIEQYRELKECRMVESSLQYRIGAFISAPVRIIRSIFNK
ncbi:glycosyltransferase family 2 protein [Dysgonomonas macrotermitis]|uniref:Glycosyltransferase involved in cell wall bisynthesis n=1 Tax=Dysgonomonas macrotermitis TaxID=1346286 RepID=A0A1M5DTG1_9BACT|nr:glycosyltransferase [Dysgonomonas macrotermitis]SHF70239.1 Glycosyltransferase involved in cell wall bisynthesis [Dysgonomonas macrotermitis]